MVRRRASLRRLGASGRSVRSDPRSSAFRRSDEGENAVAPAFATPVASRSATATYSDAGHDNAFPRARPRAPARRARARPHSLAIPTSSDRGPRRAFARPRRPRRRQDVLPDRAHPLPPRDARPRPAPASAPSRSPTRPPARSPSGSRARSAPRASSVKTGTIHAFCAELLREFGVARRPRARLRDHRRQVRSTRCSAASAASASGTARCCGGSPRIDSRGEPLAHRADAEAFEKYERFLARPEHGRLRHARPQDGRAADASRRRAATCARGGTACSSTSSRISTRCSTR